MNKEELFLKFCELFPDWEDRVLSYRKIGSKCLAIVFEDVDPEQMVPIKVSRVFLYNDWNNWQFGTKLWRRRPEHVAKT